MSGFPHTLSHEPSCKNPGLPRQPIFHGDYSFNTGEVRRVSIVDYNIFALTLFVSTVIGFYQGYRSLRNMSPEEYFTAGHHMHAFPVSLSLLASFFSGVTLISTPVEIYNMSTMNFWTGINYFIGIGAAAYIFIPLFYQLKTVSSFEYLEMRFGRGVRSVCSTMYLFYMIAYLSFCLSAPSVAISAVTGFDRYWSIITIGVVCTIYTAAGGMKAVIWTDTFQIAVSLLGTLVLLISGVMTVGGISVAWDSAVRTNRVRFNDFRTDPALTSTVWSIVIGMSTIYLSYGVNQSQVMRSQCCRSVREAKLAVLGNIPGLCVFFYLSCIIGLYMSAFYENCDPLSAKFVPGSMDLSALYMMDILGHTPGLPGIVMAGVVSATLSSVSSGLNSISAVILEDYIKVYANKNIRNEIAQILSQLTCMFFGAVVIQTTYLVAGATYLRYAALSVISLMTAPVTGVFILGILIPQVNRRGALAGLMGSIIIEFWIFIGKKLTPPPPWPKKPLMCVSNCNITAFTNASLASLTKKLAPPPPPSSDPIRSFYHISWNWDATIAVTSCIIIGVIASYITGKQDTSELDPRLIVPLFDEVFPLYYLPEPIREYFRFGIDHKGKFDATTPKAQLSFQERPSGLVASNLSLGVKDSKNLSQQISTQTMESQV